VRAPRNNESVACTTHSRRVIRDKKQLLFIYRSPSAHDVGVGELNHDWGDREKQQP
jgi:hypothetical protein